MNAVKHGLAGAGAPPLAGDRALLEARAAAWVEELGAVGDLEQWLVVEAAAASVRMQRADRTQADRDEARAARARARRLGAVRARLAAAEAELTTWTEVARTFAATRTAEPGQLPAVLELLGIDPLEFSTTADPAVAAFRSLLGRLGLDRPREERKAAAKALDAWFASSRDAAEEIVAVRRAELAEAEADGDDDGAPARVDRSKTGELLRRYRDSASRDLHRAIARLAQVRRLPPSPWAAAVEPNEARTVDEQTACAPTAAAPAAAGPPDPAPSPSSPAVETAAEPAPRNEARSDDRATTYVPISAVPAGGDDRAWGVPTPRPPAADPAGRGLSVG